MGFFSDITADDIMNEEDGVIKEVAPLVFNPTAEEDELSDEQTDDMLEESLKDEYNEEEIMISSNQEDDDNDVLEEVENVSEIVQEVIKTSKERIEKQKDKKVVSTTNSTDVTLITEKTKIDGNISCDNHCVIYGSVNGSVNANTLIVEKDAHVLKSVQSAHEMIIKGNVGDKTKTKETDKISYEVESLENIKMSGCRIQGNVFAKEDILIENDSIVIGNITATGIIIDKGAIKGNLDINGPVLLKSGAIIKGNIKSAEITMEKGAKVSGTVEQCYGDNNIIDDNLFK